MIVREFPAMTATIVCWLAAISVIGSGATTTTLVQALVETRPTAVSGRPTTVLLSRKMLESHIDISTDETNLFGESTASNHRVDEKSSIGPAVLPTARRDFLVASLLATTAAPVAPSTASAVATPSAPYTGPLLDTSTTGPLVELASGVTYRDLRAGEADGMVAEEGKRVNVQWVLKRSNGYSIDSSAQNDGIPFIFVVGGKEPPQAIPGLDEGIRGMTVGGIRRIVVPPSLAYVGGLDEAHSPGPVPPGFGPKQRIKRVMENRRDVPEESFLLDVKLTRVQ